MRTCGKWYAEAVKNEGLDLEDACRELQDRWCEEVTKDDFYRMVMKSKVNSG